MQRTACLPILRSACVTPTVTVDFPSPAGVGLMPVTSTRRPFGLRRASAPRRTLAAWAMAISLATLPVVVTAPPALERGGDPRAEHPGRVLGGLPLDHLQRVAPRPRQSFGDRAHEGRLVSPAAMRHRSEIRRVRLD